MPRQPRLVVPGLALHVVQRGASRLPCFFASQDRVFYLAALGRHATEFGCAIHAYVLMTNHVHLLLTPTRAEAPGLMMQAIGRRYVRYVNDRQGRSGTLWEGRFRSCLVGEPAYVLACHRYIEMNPVRAGMVARPGDHPWSSHRANAGLAGDPLLTPHPDRLALAATPTARRSAYLAFFDAAPPQGETGDAPLRHATRTNTVFGSPSFAARFPAATGGA
jgi:putative transposase